MTKIKCPKGWKPHCTCPPYSLEPSEKCWIHGGDWRFCPYCGKFRYNNVCASCGCSYGVTFSYLDHLKQLQKMIVRALKVPLSLLEYEERRHP